jgi:hypothetical protein
MNDYYVNNVAQPNVDHEVHRSGCSYIPTDRKYLGQFNSCHNQSNGCYWCSKECHTT